MTNLRARPKCVCLQKQGKPPPYNEDISHTHGINPRCYTARGFAKPLKVPAETALGAAQEAGTAHQPQETKKVCLEHVRN